MTHCPTCLFSLDKYQIRPNFPTTASRAALWCSGSILALGASGPRFEPWLSPSSNLFCIFFRSWFCCTRLGAKVDAACFFGCGCAGLPAGGDALMWSRAAGNRQQRHRHQNKMLPLRSPYHKNPENEHDHDNLHCFNIRGGPFYFLLIVRQWTTNDTILPVTAPRFPPLSTCRPVGSVGSLRIWTEPQC